MRAQYANITHVQYDPFSAIVSIMRNGQDSAMRLKLLICNKSAIFFSQFSRTRVIIYLLAFNIFFSTVGRLHSTMHVLFEINVSFF